MIKIFTRNDVMRYVYNETSSAENEEIKRALIVDPSLRDFYGEMLEVIGELEKLNINAPERVVQNILSYSKSKFLQIHEG